MALFTRSDKNVMEEAMPHEALNEHLNQMRDDIEHHMAEIQDLRAKLATALEGKVPDPTEWDASRFFAYSGINKKGQGFVKLRLGSTIISCDLVAARSIALDILAQSEAAYADQTIYRFFSETMGIESLPELLNMVNTFRDDREKQQIEAERG